MNALEMARTAYTSPAAPIRTERGEEYNAIADVNRALRQALDSPDASFKTRIAALHRNAKLWTIIAANVADSENALPEDLRARLFYLAEFSLQHTRQAMAKKADPGVLLDINAAVMQGLRPAAAQAGSDGP